MKWLAVLVCSIVVGAVRPAYAHHRHCTEVSEIVGRSACRRFGSTWAMPSWLSWVPMPELQIGLNARQMPTVSAPSVAGSVTRTNESPSVLSTFGPELRIGFFLRDGIYAMATAEVDASRPDGDTYITDFGGVLGARHPLGPSVIGVELVGGARMYLIGRNRNPADGEPLFDAARSVAFAELRVREELWLNPWLSAGVSLATSVLDRRDVAAGVFFSVSSRSYRGR